MVRMPGAQKAARYPADCRMEDEMTSNQYWWPDQLNLKMLRKNSPLSDPMGKDFSYAEAFKTLDLDELKNGH